MTVPWVQRHSVLYDADNGDVHLSNLNRHDAKYVNINNNTGSNSSNKNIKLAYTSTKLF